MVQIQDCVGTFTVGSGEHGNEDEDDRVSNIDPQQTKASIIWSVIT